MTPSGTPSRFPGHERRHPDYLPRAGEDPPSDGGTDMRTFGWLLLAALLALPSTARAQTEAVYQLGHFAFEDGGEIHDMKVGYVTWGKLNDIKSNAILLVPGTSGNRHGYDSHIGPGKTFDTDKYFVIGADPIGGGTSSSPQDGLGTAFPKYTIRDMVRAQHEMVTKGLGITRLLAVGGGSMGSFQTVEWGINFPDAMSGLIMIVPTARSDHHFAAVVDAFEAMITSIQIPGRQIHREPDRGHPPRGTDLLPVDHQRRLPGNAGRGRLRGRQEGGRRHVGEELGRQQHALALPGQPQFRRLEAVRRRHDEGAGADQGAGAAAAQHERPDDSRLSHPRALPGPAQQDDLCGNSLDPQSQRRRRSPARRSTPMSATRSAGFWRRCRIDAGWAGWRRSRGRSRSKRCSTAQ